MTTTKIVRVFSGPDHRSHFEDIQLEMNEFRLGSLFSLKSQLVPVEGVVFRENPLEGNQDFHCPPRKQFVITLFGAVEISVGDGSYRIFGPGDILYAEDLEGEGHKARELIGPRKSLILPVANSFNILDWK
ncbi:MAG: hypothetical protein WCK52_04590 [Betaproteobacteria bacterium]|jgi:hypothetical protein